MTAIGDEALFTIEKVILAFGQERRSRQETLSTGSRFAQRQGHDVPEQLVGLQAKLASAGRERRSQA